MNIMNRAVSLTLRIGLAIGIVLILIGEFAVPGVLSYGVLTLICTPFASVIVAFVCLLIQKDRYWASVSVIAIVMIVIGLLVAM